MQLTKLFRGKKVRAAWDQTHKRWLVSVVDICSAVCGGSYDTARNYWKQFKYRLLWKNAPIIRRMLQVKMYAKDGKLRFTDVMDYKKIVQLIQLLPCAAAQKFRGWLGSVAAKNCCLTEQLEIAEDSVPSGRAELRKFRVRRLF